MQTRTLFYGGSFNPVHMGHIQCVRSVVESQGYGKAVLIPSAMPPHKRDDLASAEDRLAMCRLAVEGDPLLTVDDIELRRTGPSYTIDTVRQLRAQGYEDVPWLIGADSVPNLPKWHEPLALLREARFVIVRRPGSEIDWSALPEAYRHLQSHVVDAPLIDISATEIRRRARAGESLESLVPPKVAAYIQSHSTYRNLPS